MKPINHAVLIRTFNRPDLLEVCLNSLKNQTFKDFNTYIVDDSMSNINDTVIQKFKSHLNIKYFLNKEKMIQSAKTFNNAFRKLEKEKYVSLLDDDDSWSNEKMYKINVLLEKGVRWVSHYYSIKSNVPSINDNVFLHDDLLNKSDVIPNSSKYFGAPSFHSFHTDCISKHGFWDEEFSRGPCQEFFTRMAINNEKIFILKENLGTYLVNEKSITFTYDRRSFLNEVQVRTNFIKKYNIYFNLKKILIVAYSSSALRNSFFVNFFNFDTSSRVICKMKILLYFFFINIFILLKKTKLFPFNK